jgi:hypothetical protein
MYEVPDQFKAIYEKAVDGGSRSARIKAFCCMCQGFEPGARQAVRECASTDCPLHAVRPYQIKVKDPNAPKGVFRGTRKGEVKE